VRPRGGSTPGRGRRTRSRSALVLADVGVRPGGVPTSVEVLNGPPAEVIEDYLQPTDLLVIGSRGIGGVRRLLLGSVSSALVQTARCPVLVVRPEPADPGATSTSDM
jgi:nucleotide-binding universal stress UspA family protein